MDKSNLMLTLAEMIDSLKTIQQGLKASKTLEDLQDELNVDSVESLSTFLQEEWIQGISFNI